MITQKHDHTNRVREPGTCTEAAKIFVLWCRLTGTDPETFGAEERDAFMARPQIAALMDAPYEVLLDAGITAARRGSLPLERWLGAMRTVRPAILSEGRPAS
jgi:hypothetical protein